MGVQELTKPRDQGVAKAMLDPNRKDFGLRISNGDFLRLRGHVRLLEEFPDGCRITGSRERGQYYLLLKNRSTGKTGNKFPIKDGEAVEYAMKGEMYYEGEPLPKFGSVAPVSAIKTAKGLLLELPYDLPPLREQRRGKKDQSPPAAKKPAPAVQKTPEAAPARPEAAAPARPEAAAPADAAETRQPEAPRTFTEPSVPPSDSGPRSPAAASYSARRRPPPTQEPEMCLEQALRVVNDWKQLRPDQISLGLRDDGTVFALQESD